MSGISRMLLLPEILRQKLGDKNIKQDVLETTVVKFERWLSETKTDLFKWMFVFWLSQIGVIAGLLVYFR